MSFSCFDIASLFVDSVFRRAFFLLLAFFLGIVLLYEKPPV